MTIRFKILALAFVILAINPVPRILQIERAACGADVGQVRGMSASADAADDTAARMRAAKTP